MSKIEPFGGGEREARELGWRSTDIDTRGLLRFVIALSTPALLVQQASRVFGSYIRGGKVTSTKREAGLYDVAFSNMGGASSPSSTTRCIAQLRSWNPIETVTS
jgi:hypothetical protein